MAGDVSAVRLFYSYAHEDEDLRNELQGHLKILERRKLIAPWHDRRIAPGQAWDAEIDRNLREADLVLLLVSADFIASDYIMGQELATAMAQHDAGRSIVVPVILRPVDLQAEDVDIAPFLRLQGLPPDLKPVTSWPQRDEAWVLVAKGLRETVAAIRARRPAAAPAAPLAPAAQAPPAATPTRPKVFVSYARADRETAQAVAHALQAAGLDTALVDSLPVGSDFRHWIERELQSSSAVVSLWSAASAASDHVRLEAGVARDAGKLVPVRIESVDVPMGFRDIQALDLIGWHGDRQAPAFLQLIKALGIERTEFVQPSAAAAARRTASRGLGLNPLAWWRQWRQTGATGAAAAPQAPADAVEARGDDEIFGDLLARVRAPLAAAARERGLGAPDAALLDRDATWLIDRSGEPPRILWVDDRPQGNQHERAALARLQIEVVYATDTDGALAQMRSARPPFDLVISDWQRAAEGPDAGLALARRAREAGLTPPIVYYHAEFDGARRAERRERALAAGALGEAVLPQELIEMVVLALRAPH